jgi:hypothetical protein
MKNALIILKQLTKNLNQETNTTEGSDRVVELKIDTCFLNLGGFFGQVTDCAVRFCFLFSFIYLFLSPRVIKIKPLHLHSTATLFHSS